MLRRRGLLPIGQDDNTIVIVARHILAGVNHIYQQKTDIKKLTDGKIVASPPPPSRSSSGHTSVTQVGKCMQNIKSVFGD